MSFPFLDYESSFFTTEELLFLAGASGGGVEHTIINNPATFTTDLAKPLRKLLIPFYPVQAGSGDPSPDNVRPIAGLTGLNINRTGKNLLLVDDSLRLALSSAYGNFSSENRVVTITGNATGGYIMPCLPNTKYVYSFESTYIGADLAVRVYEFSDYPTALSAGTMIYNENSSEGRHIPPSVFTTTATGKWLVVGFYSHHGSGNNVIISNMQIEVGATATTYEPYTEPTIIPVSWETEAGTVYGGELDALTGVLTVTHKIIDLTNVNWTWVKSSSYPGGFYASIQVNNIGIKAQTDFICSHAKVAHILSEYEYGTCYCDGSVNIRIMPEGSELTNWETFRQEQSQNGTPVCICGELATPYTVQLDPVTLSTLKGYNAIWTDTNGDNTIVYLKKT